MFSVVCKLGKLTFLLFTLMPFLSFPCFLVLAENFNTMLNKSNGGGASLRLACRQTCGAFSWLMIDVRMSNPWWLVPLLGRISWLTKENRLSKSWGTSSISPKLLLQALPPGSWLPFPPQMLLVIWFWTYHSTRNLTKLCYSSPSPNTTLRVLVS